MARNSHLAALIEPSAAAFPLAEPRPALLLCFVSISRLVLRRLALLLLVLGVAFSAQPASAQYFAFGKNRVQYDSHDWRTLRTAHFDVYYFERVGSAPGGRVLAEFAGEAAEEAYLEVSALFGTDIARRVPLIVYPTHADFAVTNAVDLPIYADGIGGVTELFKNRVAIPFTGDWRDFRRVIHHELVHAVVNDLYYGGSIQSLIRSGFRLQIPLWFNEGLAEFSAQGWDTQSDMYVRDAVLNDDLADIPRLGGYFAYRGGQGVWDFIAQEYGREKVTEILERVRVGRSVSGAIRRATGLSLNELSDRWKQTLRTVYFPEAAAREPTDAVSQPLATRERTGAGYHASPAMAPMGDKVAYVATTDGLFDVYVVPTAAGNRMPVKLIDGQDNTQFESLRLLSPGLAWSPDGKQLAVAVTSGPGDAIVLANVETGDVRTIRPAGVRAVVSVSWSPDGTRLAFEGTSGAHSDIYVMTLETEAVANVTRDVYSDHAPAWSPDGLSIAFHSDRGDELTTGRATVSAAARGSFDTTTLGRKPYDLYEVTLDSPNLLVRLTNDDVWDDTNAAYATEPDGSGRVRMMFVSDRNGIPNLYVRDSSALGARPLTNLSTGVIQASLSADGSRAAILALDEGTPSVFFLRDPFSRTDLPAELTPTIWAQRRTGQTEPAPALILAGEATLRRNAFLRDAANGEPMAAPPRRPGIPSLADIALADSILTRLYERPPEGLIASTDTVLVDGVQRGVPVDYRDYRFSNAFDEGALSRTDAPLDPFRPVAARDSSGKLIARRYQLRFTPDLVYATGGYDTVYGLQSVTQMMFSDMLGNHRISLATNLVLDLRNADYILGYESRGGRTNYSLQGFHLARELPDFGSQTVYRYRNYGVVGTAHYPLSKFRRIDAEIGLLGVSLTDLSSLVSNPRTRQFAVPKITYTVDATVPGFLGPRSGTRYAASLSGSPGPDINFATGLVDARRYWSIGPGYAVALRGSAGLSLGPDPQRFYAAGVQNWIGASFNSLPVEGPDDFVFATPVLPLRGFGFNDSAGDRFALVNVEARVPLVAALLPGPLPFFALYNLQTVGFVDAGFIADGRIRTLRDGTVDPETGEAERVLDDFLVGAGVGLRTILLGYPLRVDWSRPFDGHRFGATRTYVSVGLDF